MVKTNKKSFLVVMLVVLLSALLLVGGLTISANKPQVDAQVKAEGTSATLRGYYDKSGIGSNSYFWYRSLLYDITNLTITNNYTPQSDSYYVQIVDVSLLQDGSLKAYVFENGKDAKKNTLYDCVIYGYVDTIYAPNDSADLFYGCDTKLSTLQTIKFDNFDTSKVTDMIGMFAGCNSLTSLDLSNFDTSKVTDMSGMFAGTTFSSIATMMGMDINSSTFYIDVYAVVFQTPFVSQDGDDTNDQQEAKEIMQRQLGFADKILLKTLDISGFTISSTSNTADMFTGLELDTLVTPKSCEQVLALPTTMYKEGTAEEVTVLPSTTMTLVKDANAYASDYDTGSGSTTPATGFDTTDLIITTTLGMSLLVAVAVAFANTKKRYVKR